ncbi:MAG: GAF and ANTAR domain-containing protein [Actinomycetota bacterium]|nr:GAF and ANTAR domain-containing protein [Actinomycetota bacterium]
MTGSEANADGRLAAREALLGRTFVELADTLVEGFDVLDFLFLLCERCAELLATDAVGVLLAPPGEGLQLSAASSEESEVLEVFNLQQKEGPCYDAFVTGTAVAHGDIAKVEDRWPIFVPRALKAGFRSVYGFPLRLRDDVIGALNMFRAEPGVFETEDVLAGRAMADIATIGIMHERLVREAELRADQLRHALDGRTAIEHAKGVLAERHQVSLGEAFTLLWDYGRRNGRPLSEVWSEIVQGTLTFD